MKPHSPLAPCIVLALSVLACNVVSAARAYAAPPAQIESVDGSMQLELVATGVDHPVGIAIPPDGSGRIFVVEQTGKIRIIQDGVLLPAPFLNLTKKLPSKEFIATEYETGLLGLTFHPSYSENGKFYVFYTDKRNFIRIYEYRVSDSDPNRANPQSRRKLLSMPHPDYYNHYGGELAFGPDGYLYIGIADGGGIGDPFGTGQSLKTLKAKILRIDVNSGDPYSIPADNPFLGHAHVKPEIYAYGLRNPWRFSFDAETGRLFAADVGQYLHEEINIIEAGGNYGWSILEANECFDRDRPLSHGNECDTSGLNLIPPIYAYGRPSPFRFGTTAIIGGHVYRGSEIPALEGKYIFGDFTHGFIRTLTEDEEGNWHAESLFTHLPFYLSSFGQDQDGEIYVAAYNKRAIYRLKSMQ